MIRNKKGFTLVELLAVIVILAIILVIAVPQIIKTIDSARMSSLESTAKLIAKTAEKRKLENETLGLNETIICDDLVKLDSNTYGDCDVTFNDDGKAVVKIEGASGGKFDGRICEGTFNNIVCKEKSKPTVMNCTYDGELEEGATFTHGIYTYAYMREGNSKGEWSEFKEPTLDGWGVMLTDKESTAPISENFCTYINDKPVVSTKYMFVNSKAVSIDVGMFDTSNIMVMTGMFYQTSISKIDMSNFDMSNVAKMGGIVANTSISEVIFPSTEIGSNFSGSFGGKDRIIASNLFGQITTDRLIIKNLNFADEHNYNLNGIFRDSNINILKFENLKFFPYAHESGNTYNVHILDFSSSKIDAASIEGFAYLISRNRFQLDAIYVGSEEDKEELASTYIDSDLIIVGSPS